VKLMRSRRSIFLVSCTPGCTQTQRLIRTRLRLKLYFTISIAGY